MWHGALGEGDTHCNINVQTREKGPGKALLVLGGIGPGWADLERRGDKNRINRRPLC